MNNLEIIYPNMAHLFSDCPMKFYWKYIAQVSSPMLDKNFAVGKNIHALAAYFLKKENTQKLEKALTDREKEFWNYLKNNKYFNYTPLGVEKNIMRRLGKYWIGGRLDAIVKSDKNLYILDYKTGGVKQNMTYDYQTMIYCLLCEDLSANFETLTFVYIDLKNKSDVKIEFNNELKHEYEQKLLKICNDMNSFNPKKFEKPENCNCEYSKICI